MGLVPPGSRQAGLPAGKLPVSVVMVTHNSKAHIEDALEALAADPLGPEQVIVVDNASSDGTPDLVERYGVDLFRQPENLGFPAGCNLGAVRARHPTLAFLNHDAVPAPGWLPPLLAALDQAGVGAAMPLIDLTYRPGHFFTSGSQLTFLGFAWSTDTGQPIPGDLSPQEVPFPSGAAFAIRRALFDQLGGLRPGYFLYLEDVDFGWRLRLAGLRSLQVPASRVSHDYDFERHAAKMYYLERNRLRMLAANYQWKTLLLAAPAIAAVEVGVLAAAIKNQWGRDKLRSWRDLWRDRAAIREERRASRAVRSVSDRDMIAGMGDAFAGITQMPLPPFIGIINRALATYRGWLERIL